MLFFLLIVVLSVTTVGADIHMQKIHRTMKEKGLYPIQTPHSIPGQSSRLKVFILLLPMPEVKSALRVLESLVKSVGFNTVKLSRDFAAVQIF